MIKPNELSLLSTLRVGARTLERKLTPSAPLLGDTIYIPVGALHGGLNLGPDVVAAVTSNFLDATHSDKVLNGFCRGGRGSDQLLNESPVRLTLHTQRTIEWHEWHFSAASKTHIISPTTLVGLQICAWLHSSPTMLKGLQQSDSVKGAYTASDDVSGKPEARDFNFWTWYLNQPGFCAK